MTAERSPGGEVAAARRVIRFWALLAALWLGAKPLAPQVWAAGPVDVYQFESTEQEARYRALIAEFRCPKCLNTNLAGSDAPIAQDLRRTVHRLVVTEGLSDQQIRDYLQDRYGDFVLYNPPFRPGTWLLWLAPAVFALVGALVLWRLLRQPPADPLSEQERARLRDIVDES
jgi:cytochrome c-type biogenesis protein CcmH